MRSAIQKVIYILIHHTDFRWFGDCFSYIMMKLDRLRLQVFSLWAYFENFPNQGHENWNFFIILNLGQMCHISWKIPLWKWPFFTICLFWFLIWLAQKKLDVLIAFIQLSINSTASHLSFIMSWLHALMPCDFLKGAQKKIHFPSCWTLPQCFAVTKVSICFVASFFRLFPNEILM